METVSAATQDDGSGANPSSVKSEDSSPRPEGGRGSPPPNCAICLGTCRNKSFTDSCLHQFCFKCLLTWSKVKAECPLCKQNFKSIIHNVRSNHQYEEYLVEQRHTEESAERIDIDNLTTATRRFRYRTTLTLPRRETIAIQQLLVHYPLVADVFPPPALPAPPRRTPASFRRTVYRHNLWARPLPDFTGRFRDCTPEFYRYNDTQIHRLVPWLNRELHYLLNENVGHLSYVLSRILELLPQYHINSNEFKEAMQRYLGERTEHFLHELYCFASTPYDITGYDRNVQYTTDTRISTMVNEVISSSDSDASVDSDIVMVSHSEPAEQPPGPSRLPAPVYPQNYIPQPPASSVVPIETISHSDTDDDDSEVMVVGYIKPPQDRTPEVVDLVGSDSDVIVQDSAQPEASRSASTEQQTAPITQNLVKLSLKRQKTESGETDSEGSYRPPPRRRRRPRSNDTATTSDTCRTTPSPSPSAPTLSDLAALWHARSESSSSPYTPYLSSAPTSTAFSDTSSSTSSHSSTERRKKAKKKSKRRTQKTNRSVEKKKSKRRTRSHHKKSASGEPERDRRSKRKSYSGKGVKSSKKAEEPAASSSQPGAAEWEQPGTSGTASRRRSDRDRKRRRSSRERKRLRSVVNVMYTQKSSGDSNSSTSSHINLVNTLMNHGFGGSTSGDESTARLHDVAPESSQDSSFNVSAMAPAREDTDDSDYEDNLPLNLTVQKTYTYTPL